MKKFILFLSLFSPMIPVAFAQAQAPNPSVPVTSRWTSQRANDWYKNQPWLVGANYNPASAINQLEMWQAETFDPKRIDLELGWASSIGMNTMRVYLHDLPYSQDPRGFISRIDTFLSISQKHKIRPLFVLFDSCWDPFPQLGTQRAPIPGVHNSGWVQNPGAVALQDQAQYPRLESYVKGVVGAFAKDSRVLGWDVWNEPDNTNDASYGRQEPREKAQLVEKLLPKVFSWARSTNPTQPLTSGVWRGDWSSIEKFTAMERIQLENSDVVSFHNYNNAVEFQKRVEWLLPLGRPLLCTEYMARGNGSTFASTLPIAKKYKIAAFNWGLVAGKSQTQMPWDSWQKPYVDREPALWFHEVFRIDGTPYLSAETELIRQLTRASEPVSPSVLP